MTEEPKIEAGVMTENAVAVAQPSVPALPVQQVLTAIMSAASDPNVDVAKMRELLGLQKELMAMQAEQQFTEAFQRLSRDLPRIKKNGSVEYKGKEAFRFATWDAIDAVIRPLLEREGFILSFDSSQRQGEGGGAVVTGTLSHVGGHRRSASIPLALDGSGGKNSIQGMGSTISYGKRYCATMLLNLVTAEDDDGHKGGMTFIDEAQEIDLRNLLTLTKTDESRFLSTMCSEVHVLNEVEERDFTRLKNALLSKRNQQMKATSHENN